MIDFAGREDVARWLEGKPREVPVIFAARAALRVAPLLGAALGPRRSGKWRIGEELVLPVFRAMIVPWAAGQFPAYRAELFAAADRVNFSATHALRREPYPANVARVGKAANAAARAVGAVDFGAVEAAADAAYPAYPAYLPADAARAAADAASAAAADATVIDRGVNPATLPSGLCGSAEPLFGPIGSGTGYNGRSWRRTRIGPYGPTGIARGWKAGR